MASVTGRFVSMLWADIVQTIKSVATRVKSLFLASIFKVVLCISNAKV
jgi:hypothetical protein